MATLRELKGRIASVKSSEKITGAMKMISSAKMHKAEAALQRLVPYSSQIQLILNHLLSADANFSSPLTQERDINTISIIVFGSDDGLCGAYNAQIIKRLVARIDSIIETYGAGVNIEIIPVGKKVAMAARKLKISQVTQVTDFGVNTRSTLDQIREFLDRLKEAYIEKKTDRIEMIYTHFFSASRQRITEANLFPISMSTLLDSVSSKDMNRPYLFEPDAATIFSTILPLYALSHLQQISTENVASEQAARIMAMQSANDNAKKLLEELNLEYNKLRQQNITTELLDIIGGQKRE